MLEHTKNRTASILTATYFSRSEPGEAALEVEQVSRSNQFQHFQSKLIQRGKEKARAFGIFSAGTDGQVFKRYESQPPDIAPLKECVVNPEVPGYTLYSQMDMRVDPRYAGYMKGNTAEKSKIEGWIKFKNDRAIDTCALVLIADSFPPPIFASLGKIPWVPTIEFSVNIRNIPRTQWLKCRLITRYINCGMMEVDGEIWDEEWELIAISRQIAQFRKP
jgi:acyl-CoA thioesterase